VGQPGIIRLIYTSYVPPATGFNMPMMGL
jgi:hypothetical protein